MLVTKKSDKIRQKKPRTPRGTLTQELILRTALEIVDSEGLAGLSLRNLAARLGVATMSIYRHYKNKAEIERDLVDQVVVVCNVTNHHEEDWIEWIYTSFAKMREGLCAHPGVMSLLDNASFNATYQGINALAVMDRILLKLRDAGLSPKHSVQLFHILLAHMIGSVALMNGESRRAAFSGSDDSVERIRLRRLSFEMVPISQYPTIADLAPYIATVSEEDEFRDSVLHIIKSFALLQQRKQVISES